MGKMFRLIFGSRKYLSLVACMLLVLTAGCSNEMPSEGGVETNAENSDRVIETTSLAPGESKEYSVVTTDPVHVGVLCKNSPQGGLVQLQQLDTVSQASTSQWASRVWAPNKGVVKFRVVNNAKNQVEVIVFRGERPPQ